MHDFSIFFFNFRDSKTIFNVLCVAKPTPHFEFVHGLMIAQFALLGEESYLFLVPAVSVLNLKVFWYPCCLSYFPLVTFLSPL